MRQLLILIAFILIPFAASATHIIGGTIYYRYLGNDSFEISVRLYRDCDTGNAAFPASLSIQVKDTSGANSGTYAVALDSVRNVPSYLPICIFNPGICVEEGFYTSVRYIPPVPGGHFIYYQYCCRTGYILNIPSPLSTGTSIFAYIPENAVVNSSPVWNLRPPLFECQGNPMNYDYGATDPDGDSLVYSYYTPFNDPSPTYPSDTINFTPVTWVAGYNANNPCGGPNLTMNNAGFITGIPQNLGWYAAGVRCEEYRNGVKIGEIRRDYPFVIVTCPPAPNADFLAPAVTCFHDYTQYQNMSAGANSYFWDFGDPNTTADTSSLTNPSWQYADTGTYTVTLIANPNMPCADTATWNITVQDVYPAFTANDTLYTTVNSQFTDSSWTSNGSSIVWWYWNFGDASAASTVQNPTHIYTTIGTYTVTLIVISADGCADTAYGVVLVDLFNGINASSEETFGVCPNPSDGNILITLPFNSGELRLTDLQGREILRKKIAGETSVNLLMNIEAGTYLLEFSSGDTVLQKKIIVE